MNYADLELPDCRRYPGVKLYHLRRGATRLTRYPMPHDMCLTMRSKFGHSVRAAIELEWVYHEDGTPVK